MKINKTYASPGKENKGSILFWFLKDTALNTSTSIIKDTTEQRSTESKLNEVK